MDGVLEGAALLCVCKLACSLFFLPSLADSRSPVSFCCCCLLIFTDFLVTVFLSFLHIFESWLSELTPLGDVIALRFLIFLSHTYGVVLLLTTPLIAVETLSRLLGHPSSVVNHSTAGQTAKDLDRQRCYVGEAAAEKEAEDGDNPDKDAVKGLSHIVSYLCCLSVWVVVALNVRWRWKVEEVWAAACMHTTNSLIRCLPNLFSPMSGTMNPCWVMAFLSMLLLLLTISTGLHRQHGSTAQTTSTQTEKCGINRYWQDLVVELPAPSKPVVSGTSASEAAQSVDPEKTESSCAVHRMCSGNGVQMSRGHHGDFILASPEYLSAGQERGPTRLTFLYSSSMGDHVDSQHRSQSRWRQWGFPRPGVNVMIGFVGVLSIFVLPLNLSVNILLIRTIETLLEVCIKSLVSSTANRGNTPFSHSETLA